MRDPQFLQGGLVVRHGPAARDARSGSAAAQRSSRGAYSRVSDVDFGPDFVYFMEVQRARVEQLLQVLHRQIFLPLPLLQS